MQQICTSTLSGSVRGVKFINNTVGKMSFTTIVICHLFSTFNVKDTLEECGLERVEAAFVNLEEKKHSKLNMQCVKHLP